VRKKRFKAPDEEIIKTGKGDKLNKNGTGLSDFFPGVRIISELGLALAIPLVGGAFLGSYLDQLLGMRPKLTLSLLFTGLIIGLISMIKVIKDIYKD